MKLSYEQLRTVACGAAYVSEEKDGVLFHRFTREQEELYRVTSADYYKRAFSSAGIRLSFRTDSVTLKLKVSVSSGTSRDYFSFDVFADGKPVGYLDNFSGVELPGDYTTIALPLGSYEGMYSLGDGEKHVTIYFPWSVCPVVEEVSIDDGAFVEAVKQEKQLLAFGDSITHGYDALRPSNRYACRLADALRAEERNKAIGGERFFPALAALRDEPAPDYITVAYGTNDWSLHTKEKFLADCAGFFKNLSEAYPGAKIFAITPIWRKDCADLTKFCPFSDIAGYIRDLTAGLPNVTVINGYDFVPKEEAFYADLRLHPNDAGFDHYFSNLLAELIRRINMD